MKRSYLSMTLLRLLLVVAVLFSALTGCKKDDGTTPTPTEASQTDLLVANNWVTTSVTTADGQAINKSRLGLDSQILFSLTMESIFLLINENNRHVS